MDLYICTVSAYCMCALLVLTYADASCDNTNCVICNTDGTCTQCIDGFYNTNGNCYSCHDNCVTCIDNNYNCKVCKDGLYIFETDSYTTCIECPVNCVKCNSSSFCSKCKSGYYFKSCWSNCNICKYGACSKTDCTHGCIDGYFQHYVSDNYGYCLNCVSNCKSCTNSSHCNTCHDGFHLINYSGGYACSPCSSGCEACSTPSVCDSCPPGRWSSTCKSSCPDGCKNKTCDIFTGLCNDGCTEDYYMTSDGVCHLCLQSTSGCHCPDFQYNNGSMCVPCTNGYWGRLCNESCSSNCLERKCDNVNGHCNNCNQTHYGHFCEYKCNRKCNNPSNSSSVCNNSGACLFGCQNGWAGTTCNAVDFTSETTPICESYRPVRCVSKNGTGGNFKCVCNKECELFGSDGLCYTYQCSQTYEGSICHNCPEGLIHIGSQWTTSLTTPVSTTSSSELISSRSKQQTEDEADVPVAIIAGTVGSSVFFLIIGVCIGAVIAVMYLKRRNNPSSTDTDSASRTDPSNENCPDTNIASMSTYTDLCHVSGKETPYSTMTRTEYENINV